ncbi:MAG TPA: AzlC family ABC transporter permease [Burkholderiaceae bacterium]|nr:AzlC family ABC transporter permease [Burkholderiaceae bacterium]
MPASTPSSFVRPFLRGLATSLSIAAGYLPIAFSFGLAALQAGLSPFITILTSVVVYAGASQFVLITLMASGAGWLTAVPTVIVMNARHLFYGPALLNKLPEHDRSLPAPLLSWGLTDEVFATALGRLNDIPDASREAWYLGLQTGAYASWVGGTILGVTLSSSFTNPPVFIEAALSFILPGLFFALLLESGIGRASRTIVVTALATAVLLALLPGYHALAAGMLIGAAFNMLTARHSP